MSYWDDHPDPYYNPEAFGLEIVGKLDFSDGNYQFDYFMVWTDSEGSFYYARDSGCSCPCPFEDYHSLDQLTKATFWEIKDELQKNLLQVWKHESADEYNRIRTEVSDLVSKMRTPTW